jgi:hypothetical protein
MSLPKMALPNTKGVRKNAVALATKLIEGRETDKEKFDAIFTWVILNIRYDYGSYLSPSGSQKPNIRRILKRKRGICGDYAALMDTLCKVAGLQNVSVYGYAKDELFDVHDSIYMDNHAWNAVKLDNYWYVYDATWASGEYEWRLRRFSRWIYNWRKKLVAKVKERTYKYRVISTECRKGGGEYKVKLLSLTKAQYFLLKLLQSFRLRAKIYFVLPDRPVYYLSNPETFAITHFPDNPYWSLTGAYNSIVDFEKDSAYYHLSKEQLENQKRSGRNCGECDDYFRLDQMQKTVQLKKNTQEFNKRNRFMTALCNHEIAEMFYKQSIPVTDSATKVMLLDSTITYLQTSKADLQQSSRYVSKESTQQRAKNNTKMKLLNDENGKHLLFFRGIAAEMNKKTTKMNKFLGKKRTMELEFRAQQKKLRKMPGELLEAKSTYKVNKKLEDIQVKLAVQLKAIDLLNAEINRKKEVLNDDMTKLSDRLCEKVKTQHKLAIPFAMGTFERTFNQNDNYKKIIVTERATIGKMEQAYATGLKDSIFTLSDTCVDFGEKLFAQMKKRNDLYLQSAKMMASLVNGGLLDADSLRSFVRTSYYTIQEDICWIIFSTSPLKAATTGFEKLRKGTDFLLEDIKEEKRAEHKRFRTVNKEIDRRNKKFKNIPAQNLKFVSYNLNGIKGEKRAFLKKLKEERKAKKMKGK